MCCKRGGKKPVFGGLEGSGSGGSSLLSAELRAYKWDGPFASRLHAALRFPAGFLRNDGVSDIIDLLETGTVLLLKAP